MMKLKCVALIFLSVCMGLLAQAEPQNQITIGILTIAGPRRTLANDVTSLLEVNLSSDPRFAVVDRSELNKVLAEQALGKFGNITPGTAAKIGQLTGAQVLVSGREFGLDNHNNLVFIASVIGTETGRVFSHTVQGNYTNLVDLISDLSKKIGQTIVDQSTNLIITATNSGRSQLETIIENIKAKPQRTVMVRINESTNASLHSAQHELEVVFQKAGFIVVDDTTERRPEINITGDAISAGIGAHGNMFSSEAILQIKALDLTTGKIVALDSERAVAVDAAQQTATAMALKNAADVLAERLLPVLAR